MKKRFVAFLIMLVMIVCSVYIGGYRSLSQLREDIVDTSGIDNYNERAAEFNDLIQNNFLTKTMAEFTGIEPLDYITID